MTDVIEMTMGKTTFVEKPTYEDYVMTDEEARRLAAEMVITKMNK